MRLALHALSAAALLTFASPLAAQVATPDANDAVTVVVEPTCTPNEACDPGQALSSPVPPPPTSPSQPTSQPTSPTGTKVWSPTQSAVSPTPPWVQADHDRELERRRLLGKHAIQRGATSLVLAGAVLGVGLAAGTIRLREERCARWCEESNAGMITMAFSIFTAVSGQLAAAGARNGRRGGGHGIPALRAVAWTSYVLAIGGAVGMLVAILAKDEHFESHVMPSPAIFAVGTLAGTSLACFGVNAIIAGRQAQARVRDERRTIGPALGLWRESHTDAIRPSLGVRMTY